METLSTYLHARRLSDVEFARALACHTDAPPSERAVQKWRTGVRVPRPDHMVAIWRASEGRVQPAAFYPAIFAELTAQSASHEG